MNSRTSGDDDRDLVELIPEGDDDQGKVELSEHERCLLRHFFLYHCDLVSFFFSKDNSFLSKRL